MDSSVFEFGNTLCCKWECQANVTSSKPNSVDLEGKYHSRKANSVDPEETAHTEPSHLDLHCVHRFFVWSAGPKWFILSTQTDRPGGIM